MDVVHLQIVPLPKPADAVGTVVRTILGVYAVLAESAVILAPAMIDEALAVVRIVLLQPARIEEQLPATILLIPTTILCAPVALTPEPNAVEALPEAIDERPPTILPIPADLPL